MAYALTLTDEQYTRLERAAELVQQTPERMLAEWIEALPIPQPMLSDQDYERRVAAALALSGSIKLDHPVLLEDLDEILADEYMDTHDAEPE